MIATSIRRQFDAEKQIANFALAYIPELLETLKAFEGKKVIKVDGSKIKNLADKIKALNLKHLDGDKGKRVWIDQSYKSIVVRFDFWVSFGTTKSGLSDGNYYKIDVYVGALESDTGGILKEVYSPEKALTRIKNIKALKWSNISKTIIKAEKLKVAFESENNKLPYYARIK